MPKVVYDEKNTIFALDIGTRSVIGLVVSNQEGVLKVLAQSMVEHQSRAMLDGQIHDIPRVAEAVAKVKLELEKKLKFSLKRVAIAAAGRSLKTCQCNVEQILDEDAEIDSIMVHGLEVLGVQRAQAMLESGESAGGEERFFCVGYSVVAYYLNDYTIFNLIGHKGKKIGADVLATFLPASVVTSLHAVLARVNLEPLNLTLEPIAACEAIIPEQLRLLNLALVDVGAGTSDIAITKEGSVRAYGMVPLAGDEITELIVQTLMVDFLTAEKLKRSLGQGKALTYKDVLGIENKITSEEIIKLIDPVLEKLAEEVSKNIIELNGSLPPKSVMLVGGGSQIPTLGKRIADRLGLAEQRVALRNRTHIVSFQDMKKSELIGPESVTVVGIALVAAKKMGQNFINITVNGKIFTLFNTWDLNIINALGLLEFNPRDLLGYNGKDLRFSLNGKPCTVYGEMGEHAVITVNGHPANLRTLVKDGDVIQVTKAKHGKDATAVLGDFLPQSEEQGETVFCTINGKEAGPEHLIYPGDLVEVTTLSQSTDPSNNKSQVGLLQLEETGPGLDISVTVNNQPILLRGKREYMLIDVFNYIDIDTTKINGLFTLSRNGEEIEYTDLLQTGDIIEIKW